MWNVGFNYLRQMQRTPGRRPPGSARRQQSRSGQMPQVRGQNQISPVLRTGYELPGLSIGSEVLLRR